MNLNPGVSDPKGLAVTHFTIALQMPWLWGGREKGKHKIHEGSEAGAYFLPELWLGGSGHRLNSLRPGPLSNTLTRTACGWENTTSTAMNRGWGQRAGSDPGSSTGQLRASGQAWCVESLPVSSFGKRVWV